MTKSDICKLAEKFIDDYGTVDNFIKTENIEVINYTFEDGIISVLVKRNDKFVIGVLHSLSKSELNMVIAHCVGHLILHRDKAEKSLFVDKFIRRPRVKSKDSDLEIEANYFAELILIPCEKLSSMSYDFDYLNDELYLNLSKQFNVPISVMIKRLLNLRLL